MLSTGQNPFRLEAGRQRSDHTKLVLLDLPSERTVENTRKTFRQTPSKAPSPPWPPFKLVRQGILADDAINLAVAGVEECDSI